MNSTSIESLGALLQFCETFAKQRLHEAGEFAPFGAFVNQEQRLELFGVKGQTPHEMLEMLSDLVRHLAREGRLLSYAVAANVNIPAEYRSPLVDGIRVQVEAPGYSRFLYTPYRILPFRPLRRFLAVVPTVEYGQEIAVDVPPIIFRDEAAA